MSDYRTLFSDYRTFRLHNGHYYYSRASQPAAHGPHAAREAILCGLGSHIHFNSFSWIKEIMKLESTVLRSLAQYNMMGLMVKILWKIYKTPPNFASCSPPQDLTDRCAARGWFRLESPILQYKLLDTHDTNPTHPLLHITQETLKHLTSNALKSDTLKTFYCTIYKLTILINNIKMQHLVQYFCSNGSKFSLKVHFPYGNLWSSFTKEQGSWQNSF